MKMETYWVRKKLLFCNMKKCLSTLLFVTLIFGIRAQDVWTLKDSVNGPGRSVAASFVMDGQGWLVSGLYEEGFKRKMYSYNPIQDDWDNELSLGGESGDGLERGSASAFSLLNKGYLCLGQGNFQPYSNDLWEYDPGTQAWSQKADFIGESRRQAVSFTIDNYAYVGTGQGASGLKNDFYRYNPVLNIWAPIADFGGTARRQAVSFAIGDKGYVGTGDDGIARNDFWQYYPAANAWSQKANFPGSPRSGAVGWGYGYSGVIALGEDNTSAYRKDVWQYYYFGDVWVQRTDFSGSPRKNAVAFVINDQAFVGTGYDGDFKDDFYAYNYIVGIEDSQMPIVTSCYPNPTKDYSIISMSIEQIKDVIIEIYSPSGQKINFPEPTKIGAEIKLDLSTLPLGNYIYKLIDNSNKQFSTGKISKQ